MVTFKLKKNENDSKYWMLTLPAPWDGRADDVIRYLKVAPYSMEANCLVVGVESPLPLEHLVGQKINLYDAENLFLQLQSLTGAQLQKFCAVVSSNLCDLKSMINLTLNLDCYTFSDSSDAVVTPYGMYEQIGEPVMTKYNGISLPPVPPQDDDLILIKIASAVDDKRFGYQYLPGAIRETDKILNFIGCNSLSECNVTYAAHRLTPSVFQRISRLDIMSLNHILENVLRDEKVNKMQYFEVEKYPSHVFAANKQCSMKLRDILPILSSMKISLEHETNYAMVFDHGFAKLTWEGVEKYAALLNATVQCIQSGGIYYGTILTSKYDVEVVLSGVDPQVLIDFNEDLKNNHIITETECEMGDLTM